MNDHISKLLYAIPTIGDNPRIAAAIPKEELFWNCLTGKFRYTHGNYATKHEIRATDINKAIQDITALMFFPEHATSDIKQFIATFQEGQTS